MARDTAGGSVLFRHDSAGAGDRIETTVLRDETGRYSLICRRFAPEGEDAVRLTDPGRPEALLAFAKAVSESHTHPRMIPELWEEFAP